MQELFETQKHISLSEAHKLVLIDTCFFLDEVIHHHEDELIGLAITSFNCEELVHVSKHLPGHLKKAVRKFLSEKTITIVDIPVHPGDWTKEKEFVNKIDNKLLEVIRDPSDAVLLAAALKTRSIVLTKDKHHLFTVALENHLNNYGLYVFKDMHSYKRWSLDKHQ